MSSNLKIQSNLMIDEGVSQEKHRYLPGDFIAIIHPVMVDKRTMYKELTPRQIAEYNKYIACAYCKKYYCNCLPNKLKINK